MEISLIKTPLSIVQVETFDSDLLSIHPFFLANTEEELSLVLPTEQVPKETLNRDDGWLALKINGVLDFSLVGILAKISSLLAEKGISIFAVSTFNTDYILIKDNQLTHSIQVLKHNGYNFTDL